ncbi:MAG: CvpA family protein [Oscillospiraceae bacterium]
MSIVLDLIILAIVVLTIFYSAKRGFVRTVLELVGFVLALLVASNCSTYLSNFVYDNMIEAKLNQTVCQFVETNGADAVKNIQGSLPGFVVTGANSLGVDFNKISHDIMGESAPNAAAKVVDAVAHPVIDALLQTLFYIIIAMALMVLVRFLSKRINSVFNIPILGTANKILGGCIGVVKGAFFALIFCFIISSIVVFTKQGFLIFTKEAIANSHVFKALCGFNPFFK